MALHAVAEQATTYEDLVAEGKQVIRERDGTNWKAGDLALKVESLQGVRSDLSDASERSPLKQYAEDIEVNYKTLTNWRQVSEAWPRKQRVRDVSWTVHKVLVAQPDRFELIKDQPTLKEARQIVRDRDEPVGKPDVLPASFGDRLLHSLGDLVGTDTSIQNLFRSNDGRKFQQRHLDLCARYGEMARARAELLEAIGRGEYEAIDAQAFAEILNRPWVKS